MKWLQGMYASLVQTIIIWNIQSDDFVKSYTKLVRHKDLLVLEFGNDCQS